MIIIRTCKNHIENGVIHAKGLYGGSFMYVKFDLFLNYYLPVHCFCCGGSAWTKTVGHFSV